MLGALDFPLSTCRNHISFKPIKPSVNFFLIDIIHASPSYHSSLRSLSRDIEVDNMRTMSIIKADGRINDLCFMKRTRSPIKNYVLFSGHPLGQFRNRS